jgi:hypothetical protein
VKKVLIQRRVLFRVLTTETRVIASMVEHSEPADVLQWLKVKFLVASVESVADRRASTCLSNGVPRSRKELLVYLGSKAEGVDGNQRYCSEQ